MLNRIYILHNSKTFLSRVCKNRCDVLQFLPTFMGKKGKFMYMNIKYEAIKNNAISKKYSRSQPIRYNFIPRITDRCTVYHYSITRGGTNDVTILIDSVTVERS